MKLNLTSYLNQTVSICIPAIDEQARPYKLLGIELYGLWLQGDDPTGGLLAGDVDAPAPTTLTAFVPFAQIGCVVVASMPVDNGATPEAKPAQTAGRTPATATAGQAAPTASKATPRRRNRRQAS
jgi:hypothetical protein